MNKFPSLNRWFSISPYYVHNQCKTISLLMKDGLSDEEIREFAKEFAKLMCRIRCGGQWLFGDNKEDLCIKFQKAVNGQEILTQEEKEHLAQSIFFEGIISQKKFDENGTYKDSIDAELFNGHFGEILYYIVREQFLEDEKIMIEPDLPKSYSKDHGIDYTEVRKNSSSNEYYFIIGEVKTTDNTMGNYPDKIVDSILKRSPHLIYSHINAFKEKAKHIGDNDLIIFTNEMPIYYAKKPPVANKRFAGVINYGTNKKHGITVFQNFKTKCDNVLYDDEDCRRVGLVGINNINDVKKKVLEVIWKILLE